MIHLANSGLAGSPLGADGAAALTPIPATPATKPLNEGLSFADIVPSAAVRQSHLTREAMPSSGIELPELDGENLPDTPLPVGKSLPVAEQMPVLNDGPELNAQPIAVAMPPLAYEDLALERPKLDRMPAAPRQMHVSVTLQSPQGEDTAAQKQAQTLAQSPAQPTRQPTSQSPVQPPVQQTNQPLAQSLAQALAEPSADTNRQISSLAMAAAQMLSTPKPKMSGDQAVTAKPSSAQLLGTTTVNVTEVPVLQTPLPSDLTKDQAAKLPNLTPMPEQTKALAKPVTNASIKQTALTDIASSATEIELATETKTLAPRSVAEPAPAVPQNTPSGQAPTTTILAPNGELTTTTAADAKPIAPQPARADQQASLDRFADQVAAARETAQPGSANIRLPHDQFGQIRLQLELAGAGLKISLGNSDPGFASSVQLALAERVSSSSDAPRGENSAARQDSSAQQNGQSAGNNTNMGSGQFAGQNAAQSQSQSDAQQRGSLSFEEALSGKQPNASSTAEKSSAQSEQDGLFA